MRKSSAYSVLLSLLFLSTLFLFFKAPVGTIVNGTSERLLTPLSLSIAQAFFARNPGENKEQSKLLDEVTKSVHDKRVKKEILALQDQFKTSAPTSIELLPASIIGFLGYIPNVSVPTDVILNKGSGDGVATGQIVVYKDNLVGVVEQVTTYRSKVRLLTKDGLTFTAMTAEFGVNGLIAVEDGEILFKNVLISDALRTGDIVITKGEQNLPGSGIPPNIVVGRVTAVDKKPSALFQVARITSIVNILTLQTVFIYIPAQ